MKVLSENLTYTVFWIHFSGVNYNKPKIQIFKENTVKLDPTMGIKQ